MKKLFWEHKFPLVAFLIWMVLLSIAAHVSADWWQLQFLFLGPTPWSNFDGAHYVGIAENGYGQFQQAFFPLYPSLLLPVAWIGGDAAVVGMLISRLAFLGGLVLLYHYAKKYGEHIARWTIIWVLSFSTSFFFAAVYTESVFFLLVVLWLIFLDKKSWFWLAIITALATSTRLVGVFLLPVFVWYMFKEKQKSANIVFLTALGFSGFGAYMVYLWVMVGDPLAFIHVQPYFGANRSGTALVTPPQVLWRYIKIFLTVDPKLFQFWVSCLEFMSFLGGLWILLRGWRYKEMRPILTYSLFCILLPSLSGTFSSMPRYLLSAPPLFLVIGRIYHSQWAFLGVALLLVGLIVGVSLFLAGYFVS